MPARPLRLDEVRDRLRERGCLRATRDAVWALLVHRARIEGEAWTIACLGCALPDLLHASRQLSRGLPDTPSRPAWPVGHTRRAVAGIPDHSPSTGTGTGGGGGGGGGGRRLSTLGGPAGVPTVRGDHPACRSWVSPATAVTAVWDLEAAVLAGFLAELMIVDLTRPRVLGRLRSAAHEAGVLARREMTGAPIPHAQLFTSSSPRSPAGHPLARHPDLVLARAVAARAITRGEAALIGSTRLEPTSLAEVAVRRGQPYRDVRAARIRAERKLSVFLRDQDTGSIEAFLSRAATRTSTARPGTAPADNGTGRGVGGENPRSQTRRRDGCGAVDDGRTDRRPAAPAATSSPVLAPATDARSAADTPGGERRDAATAATGTPPASLLRTPLPRTPRRRVRRRRGVALPPTLRSPTSPARAEASSASKPAPPTPARSVRPGPGLATEPVLPGPDAATGDAAAKGAAALDPPGRGVVAVVNRSFGDRS